MSWKEILEKFAAEYDVQGFAYDPERGASLAFDGSVTVEFRETDGALALTAVLGDVAEFARNETTAAMLRANHPSGELGGAWLALDDAGEKAVLARRLDAGAGYGTLVDALERFVAGAELWRGRLG